MKTTAPATSPGQQQVDAYLARLGPTERAELERVRRIVLGAAPGAVERISYGMPAFTYNGAYLVGYNALKHHFAFYPTSEPIDVFRSQLGGYSLSRGTIRYTLATPLPANLIAGVVHYRLGAIESKRQSA